ncbi:uncharacterized protein LOC133921734 isoform X2 [Phragmites australis]|uniref:uncharacterized protein LOC133921734 isoform X2 n=1 Tax=Phragmites australis TaxID=29695 RepID=UPI002D76CF2D|nr:uncharacterized protein LOC133921734 isoform X2 [Phragmites australis]
MEQADGAGSKEVSSGHASYFAHITEQRNNNVNSSSLTWRLTQWQHYDPTCQNASHPYQPSDGHTCSLRIGLDSPGASNVQQQSANQTMTSSTVEHMPESGLQSEQITIELNRLLMSLSDHTSSFAQVAEQRNVDANSSSLTQSVRQQQYCDQTCQTAASQYQSSGENNCPVRTWLDSPGASNDQRQSTNQTTTGSISEQYMLESGLQSDPFTTELSQLLMLRDLMTKRHLSERQKLVLECEMVMAETKRKFDEQFHNLDMDTLQKKKEIEILQDKICKQQILAETFQVIHKASTGVVSCSQREVHRWNPTWSQRVCLAFLRCTQENHGRA